MFHGSSRGWFISHMMFYFRIFIQLATSIFSKYLRVSIIKNVEDLNVIFVCCEKIWCSLCSCLVLGFTAGTFFFFLMHVLFMLCCGVGGGGDNSRQILYSFSGICQLTVQTPQDLNYVFLLQHTVT